MSGGQVAARLIAFFGTIYLARTLGTEAFGIIGFATALCGYFSITSTSGQGIMIREVALHPRNVASIAASVSVVRFGIAVLAFAALCAAMYFWDDAITTRYVVVLTGLVFFAVSLDVSWAFKGLEKNQMVGLALGLSQLLYVGTLLLLVSDPDDLLRVPLAQFGGQFVVVLGLSYALYHAQRITLNLAEGWRLIKSSLVLLGIKIARTLTLTFDVLLIGLLLTNAEVGIYTAAYRLCFFMRGFSISINHSYLPAFTRLYKEDPAQLSKLATQMMELGIWLSAPFVVGGFLLAEPLMTTFFGAAYTDGAGAMRLLLLSIGFQFLYGTFHNLFLVAHRLRTELVVLGMGAALNIGLNLLLIPRYGILGAAVATAITDAGLVLVALGLFYQMGFRIRFLAVVKYLPLALFMGVGVWLIGTDHSLLLTLPVGITLYLVPALFLGLLPPDVRGFMLRSAWLRRWISTP